jgi:hypothetical protein
MFTFLPKFSQLAIFFIKFHQNLLKSH